ncbi:MAG: metal-dependent hydrolase [Candidatus Bilamarchaeaceae archaeon]
MPWTPFHIGPALLLGVLLFAYVDIFAIAVGSVFMDLEPLAVRILHLDYPAHGFFHTLLGVTLAGILVALLVQAFNKRFGDWVHENTEIPLKTGCKPVFAGVLIGAYSHVLLDSVLYSEMAPFYPSSWDPLLGLMTPLNTYFFCLLCMFLVPVVYIIGKYLKR